MLGLWISRIGELSEPPGFPGTLVVKNLPAMRETWVQFLGWEDPLEKGKATHVSVLTCRILWTEDPGRLQSIGSQKVRHN